MRRSRNFSVPLRALTLAGLMLMQTPVWGQSFLEKLEQAVKNQLAESTSNEPPAAEPSPTNQEELPAPTNPSARSQPDGNQPAVSSGEVPVPAPAPAPMNRPNVTPSPPRVAESNSPSVDREAAGHIYLGLEAEEPVGGGIGVRVTGVANQSPAWKAGFEIGDRILAVEGYAIGSLDDMVRQLSQSAPGKSARFLVSRGGRNLNLVAVLMDADLAGAIGGSSGTNGSDEAYGQPFLGLTVNDLTESFRRQFGIKVFRGAAVSVVASRSPANAAGIRAGDAIIEANGVPIDSADALLDWVASTRPGQKAELLVYRGGIPTRVELVIGASENEPPSGVRSILRSNITSNTNPNAGLTLAPSSLGTSPRNEAVPSPAPALSTSGEASNVEATPTAQVSQDAEAARSIQALQNENARLSQELTATQEELKATREKLDQILQLLNDRR